MVVNLLNILEVSSIRNEIGGDFIGGTFVGGNNTCKTNSINNVLLNKKTGMNDKQLIEVAKSLLNSRYDGDIDKFSNMIGIPQIQLYNFLMGGYDLPDYSKKSLENYITNGREDRVILGDNIEGDKIMGNKDTFKGDQYNFNVCSGSESKEEILILKSEIKSLKKKVKQLKDKK